MKQYEHITLITIQHDLYYNKITGNYYTDTYDWDKMESNEYTISKEISLKILSLILKENQPKETHYAD